MIDILDQVELEPKQEQTITSESVRRYLKMLKLDQELKKEMQEFSRNFQKDEIQSISNYFNVPKYLSVREVANLTGVSQQIVRRHCASEKYKGYQVAGPNGTWNVESDQFRNHPSFVDFIYSRNEKFARTKQVAEIAKELINDDDELGE